VDGDDGSGREGGSIMFSLLGKLFVFVMGAVVGILMMVFIKPDTRSDWAQEASVAMGKSARGAQVFLKMAAEKGAEAGKAVREGVEKGSK